MIAIRTLPPSEFTPFLDWARQMTEDLSAYNIAGPRSELEWGDWAVQLFNIQELAGRVPHPMTFGDWRRWAGRLISNLG